jgi:MinD-like ATPase involved in chromosome partitioning or flagellar assembly
MFVSARDGEGTSSVAASYALLVSKRASKPTWLVDLDLRRNAMFRAFDKGFARGVDKPGRAYDAALRTEPICVATPAVAGEDNKQGPQRLLGVHPIKNSRLMVTRFRTEKLRKGQRVQLRTRPEWWNRVRRIAGAVVVDAPSLSRSEAALAMASQMDGIFIVVEADATGADEVVALRDQLEAHGGYVAGVVMNRIGADADFADRLAG